MNLFGDIGNPTPKVGGRIWHTAPLSILVHIVAVAGIVLVPSMAVDATRPPLEFAVVSLSSPLPPAPESPPPPPPSDPLPVQTPLPPLPEASSERARPAMTFNVGRIDGIESRVPGGVAGGIVGGLVGAPPAPPPPVTPVRVGGRILPPTKLRDIAPMYPSEAALAGVQGIVIPPSHHRCDRTDRRRRGASVDSTSRRRRGHSRASVGVHTDAAERCSGPRRPDGDRELRVARARRGGCRRGLGGRSPADRTRDTLIKSWTEASPPVSAHVRRLSLSDFSCPAD